MIKDSIPLLPVEIEAGNFHIFIEVKIGRKKARLLLDTGASKTAFDLVRIENFLSSSRTTHPAINSIGLGSSEVQTHIYELSSIKIGEIKLKEVEVAALDLSHVNLAYEHLNQPPVDGVLGSDLLMQLNAVIDFGKKVLKLKQK